MTTGVKVALGIAIAAALGVGGFYQLRTVQNESVTENETATENTNGKKMAFGDFAKQGGTYMCTITGTAGGSASKGTIYTHEGKVRGDVEITAAQVSATASFIIRDGYVYYWNTALPKGQGIKLKYDLSTYKAGDFDQFDQIGDYDCKEWTADTSKFTVPTNITFQAAN